MVLIISILHNNHYKTIIELIILKIPSVLKLYVAQKIKLKITSIIEITPLLSILVVLLLKIV